MKRIKSETGVSSVVGEKKLDVLLLVAYVILTLFGLLIVVPFINVLVISITSEFEYVRSPFVLFPANPTLDSYRALFEDGRIWVGYRATSLILLLGLPTNMLLTVCTAYGLLKIWVPREKTIYVLCFVHYVFFWRNYSSVSTGKGFGTY